MSDSDSTPDTIKRLKDRSGKNPLPFVVDSEGGDPELAAMGASIRAAFCKAGYPAFPSVARAAKALSRLCSYKRMPALDLI
jgi:hypothetical protein